MRYREHQENIIKKDDCVRLSLHSTLFSLCRSDVEGCHTHLAIEAGSFILSGPPPFFLARSFSRETCGAARPFAPAALSARKEAPQKRQFCHAGPELVIYPFFSQKLSTFSIDDSQVTIPNGTQSF